MARLWACLASSGAICKPGDLGVVTKEGWFKDGAVSLSKTPRIHAPSSSQFLKWQVLSGFRSLSQLPKVLAVVEALWMGVAI